MPKFVPCWGWAFVHDSVLWGGWAWAREAVQPCFEPDNFLLPFHAASLHVGRASGPPRALGWRGGGHCSKTADGWHEDRPREGPGLPGTVVHFRAGMTAHAQWHSIAD